MSQYTRYPPSTGSTPPPSSNPSVGLNGDPAPIYSTEVGATDPNGDLQSLLVDADGALIVKSFGAFVTQDLKILFNEVTNIAVGIATDINTYTAPSGKTSYLLSIINSGGNRATYNVYFNGSLLDRQYTNVAQLSAPFDYKTGSSGVPGMVIPVGQILRVETVNSGTSVADFNSRFMILEVT